MSQEDWEQNRAEGFRYCAIVEQEAIAALPAVWTYSPTHWEVAAVSTAPAFRKMGYGKFHVFQEGVSWWIKPPATSLVLGTLADLYRSKTELLAENALLRQQLIILRRQVKRPSFQKTDRFLLVLLARIVRKWKQALFLVQPETLLSWHRELFRLFWKRKSKVQTRKPKLSPETISLIQEMAAKNWLWGADRIRMALSFQLVIQGIFLFLPRRKICLFLFFEQMSQVANTGFGEGWSIYPPYLIRVPSSHAVQSWARASHHGQRSFL